jgi:hypothetical protein
MVERVCGTARRSAPVHIGILGEQWLGSNHPDASPTVDRLQILSAGGPATRLQLDFNAGRYSRSENKSNDNMRKY